MPLPCPNLRSPLREVATAFTSPGSALNRSLRTYFYSGWAFFMPYLGFYALYEYQGWPATSLARTPGFAIRIPALIHVYWALHLLNVICLIIAARSWFSHVRQQNVVGFKRLSREAARIFSRPLFPWLLLTVLLALPGVYLEWPADPWEHLRRITEWSSHGFMGAHSSGYKSFYFFAYSFLCTSSTVNLLPWLNVYYTAACLLVLWQYYRIGKTVGLDQRWAFLFVLINAITFGNSVFSFYRYYGLSTTLFAQLGAVAIARITLESIRLIPHGNKLHLCGAVACIASLAALIAANHIQALPIAGLSAASIAFWSFTRWKVWSKWLLMGCTVMLSVAVIFWWPKHPGIASTLQPAGWINSWYGFDLISTSSASFKRALQIIGAFGLLNLGAGIVLLRRNHIAGWLTVGPVLALLLPFVAVPFANYLAAIGPSQIIIFHRLLFAVPSGLALVCCLREYIAYDRHPLETGRGRRRVLTTAICGTMILILLPPSSGSYNRLWHSVVTVPNDLSSSGSLPAIGAVKAEMDGRTERRTASTDAFAAISNAFFPGGFPSQARSVGQPSSGDLKRISNLLATNRPTLEVSPSELVRDPFMSDPGAWTSLAGKPPEFIDDLKGFHNVSTALQNPAGQMSQVFTAEMSPIDNTSRYYVEISVKQEVGDRATAFLAVAWYDQEGKFLPSNSAVPDGAGLPYGWHNGGYSYFGIEGTAAPTGWTTYRKAFGRGNGAQIPTNAKFVRVGALLNYNWEPDAVIRLTNLRLWSTASQSIAEGEFPQAMDYIVVIPDRLLLTTSGSQAGQMSRHWPPQQLATDFAGGPELQHEIRERSDHRYIERSSRDQQVVLLRSPSRDPAEYSSRGETTGRHTSSNGSK